MANKELAELLEKINDIRRTAPLVNATMDSVVKLIKGELFRKKARQTGPAKGQTYRVDLLSTVAPYVYGADDFDLKVCKYRDLYPEERFAEAELRAKELIVGVNKRRRELNEGKESGERKCYIVYMSVTGLDVWGESRPSHNPGFAYPFGLFKDSSDCNTFIHEFKDELEWFYKEYLPLMEELDDYDWADAPGWGGKA